VQQNYDFVRHKKSLTVLGDAYFANYFQNVVVCTVKFFMISNVGKQWLEKAQFYGGKKLLA
jgi:hypothetical protein